jgi:hypothetical protein
VYNQIPKTSILLRDPKEELFPVFMKKGVCNHGWTVNQPAEVANVMLKTVRQAPTIFNAIVATEAVLRVRNQQLTAALLRVKSAAIAGRSSSYEATWQDTWPASRGSHIPAVDKALRASEFSAGCFPDPVEVRGGDELNNGQVFTVTQPPYMGVGGAYVPQIVHTVRPENMKHGKYEEACTCGRCATKKVVCDHFTKVLTTHVVNHEVPLLTTPTTSYLSLPLHYFSNTFYLPQPHSNVAGIFEAMASRRCLAIASGPRLGTHQCTRDHQQRFGAPGCWGAH